MPKTVEQLRAFHVTRALPYNPHPELAVGDRMALGQSYNPFFGFYEQPRRLTVTAEDGKLIHVPAMTWIKAVRDGRINPNNLPKDAHDLVQHFQMLSRELLLEMVRLQAAPDSPSRMSCLWVVHTHQEAGEWLATLGGAGRIVELSLTGKAAVVDAKLMAGDTMPYSEMIANAHSYWREEMTAEPQREVLFSGSADVVRFAG